MARMAGFERVADGLGHCAEFYTMTCPRRMHSRLGKSGKPNPSYAGTTPSEAQRYLCKVWTRIRSKLDRDDIRVFGFRIVEPHLAEVGAWAGVDESITGRLLDHILTEARDVGVQRAFVLTDDATPFEARGFERCTLSGIPEKRDRHCVHCPRVHRCAQVALQIDLAVN